jgi:nitric oxide reductase NorQ protein
MHKNIIEAADRTDIKRHLATGVPSKLPATHAIIGVIMSAVDSDVATWLSEQVSETGRVKGKSATYTLGAPVEGTTIEDKPHAIRPNGEAYYFRKWGEYDDVDVVRKSRTLDKAILMYGAPGCGKTALVEAAYGEELLTVLGTGDTEVSDFIGSYTIDGKGGFLWQDGPLVIAMREGRPLLIDEVGIIDPKVMTTVYGAMDGRRELVVTANPMIGVVKAQPGFFIVAATNPNAPGVRLSEALLSRFSIHVEMTTDWALARQLGVPIRAVTAANNLETKTKTGIVSWAPQFRELLAFRDLEKSFGKAFAIANLIASAPERDRAIVIEVMSQVFGQEAVPARI